MNSKGLKILQSSLSDHKIIKLEVSNSKIFRNLTAQF